MPTGSPPHLGLGGVALEEIRLGRARLALSFVGFGRGRPSGPAGSLAANRPADADSLTGGGLLFGTVARRATGAGLFALSLAAQAHDLDGRLRPAGMAALEWTLAGPRGAVALTAARASSGARLPAVDRLTHAPRHDESWSAQARLLGGRAEAHTAGVWRGGDEAVDARSVQFGGSTNWGRSRWYSGTDATWDRNGFEPTGARRAALHGGYLAPGSTACLARLERARSGAAEATTSLGLDGSMVLRGGHRISLEPRLRWRRSRLVQAELALGAASPLAWHTARITASLGLSGARDAAFAPRVSELELG